MAEPHHTKIITRTRRDGQVEVSVYDHTGEREHRTGLVVPASQADATCRKLAETLKRPGNRVSHKEV